MTATAESSAATTSGTKGFTPGPWSVYGSAYPGVIVDKSGEQVAAALSDAVQSEAERHANARLIAAAPELYEALTQAEIAVQELCNDQNPANECWNILRSIRTALSKANGEQ